MFLDGPDFVKFFQGGRSGGAVEEWAFPRADAAGKIRNYIESGTGTKVRKKIRIAARAASTRARVSGTAG